MHSADKWFPSDGHCNAWRWKGNCSENVSLFQSRLPAKKSTKKHLVNWPLCLAVTQGNPGSLEGFQVNVYISRCDGIQSSIIQPLWRGRTKINQIWWIREIKEYEDVVSFARYPCHGCLAPIEICRERDTLCSKRQQQQQWQQWQQQWQQQQRHNGNNQQPGESSGSQLSLPQPCSTCWPCQDCQRCWACWPCWRWPWGLLLLWQSWPEDCQPSTQDKWWPLPSAPAWAPAPAPTPTPTPAAKDLRSFGLLQEEVGTGTWSTNLT